MKKCAFVLLSMIFAGLSLAAQENDKSVYHLLVVNRAKCPGAVVGIDEPIAAIAHGKTGYYILFGKGLITLPAGAAVMVDLSANRPSAIYEYLSEASFKRYVSNPGILEGFKFAVKEEGK